MAVPTHNAKTDPSGQGVTSASARSGGRLASSDAQVGTRPVRGSKPGIGLSVPGVMMAKWARSAAGCGLGPVTWTRELLTVAGSAAVVPRWFESVSGRHAKTAVTCGLGGRCCRPVGRSGNRGRCPPPVCAAVVTPPGPARSSRYSPLSTERPRVPGPRVAGRAIGKGLARNPGVRGLAVDCCRWSLPWSVARTTQKRHQRQRHQNRRVYPWGSAPHPWPEAAHNETAVTQTPKT